MLSTWYVFDEQGNYVVPETNGDLAFPTKRDAIEQLKKMTGKVAKSRRNTTQLDVGLYAYTHRKNIYLLVSSVHASTLGYTEAITKARVDFARSKLAEKGGEDND